jgi:hypothetical protein
MKEAGMLRPRYFWCLLFVPVLLTLALSGPGCGGSAEQPLVRQFFQASRLADTMTLGNIATVSLDPKKDGAVDGFSIVSVTPDQTRELKMVEYATQLKDAQAALDAFSKKMKEFQDANTDAIDRVLKAESKNAKVGGKDAQVQAEWTKWREDLKQYNHEVSDARSKLSAERRVAELSVADRDVTAFGGTEFSKEVTVDANLRMPDGSTVKKTIVLTMQRVVLKDEKGQDINGKWMFTNLVQK